MPSLPSYKEMPIWQRAMQLAVEVCQVSMQLPGSSKAVLGIRLQETVLDIPTLLARGSKGGTSGFLKALAGAAGAAAELETLVILAQNVYGDKAFIPLHDNVVEMQSAIAVMGRSVSASRPPQNI